MQTDFIIWSFVNNSISKFGNGNFLIDLSLFIGIIYFLLPHYAKNIIRRYIKNLINGKENLIEFSGSKEDFNFNLSLESYETMGKPNSDKYEFIYPNYSLTKTNYFEDKIFDNLEFDSSGNNKT